MDGWIYLYIWIFFFHLAKPFLMKTKMKKEQNTFSLVERKQFRSENGSPEVFFFSFRASVIVKDQHSNWTYMENGQSGWANYGQIADTRSPNELHLILPRFQWMNKTFLSPKFCLIFGKRVEERSTVITTARCQCNGVTSTVITVYVGCRTCVSDRPGVALTDTAPNR